MVLDGVSERTPFQTVCEIDPIRSCPPAGTRERGGRESRFGLEVEKRSSQTVDYADAADSDPSPRGRPNSTSIRTVS